MLPIRYAVLDPGSGLNVTSPIVRGGVVICAASGFANVDVTPLITIKEADEARDKVVPETIIAGPPGRRVCSPRMKLGPETSGRAPNTSLPMVMVMIGVMVGAARLAMVEVAAFIITKAADDASERVVPETVIAGPPGARVWPPITKVGAIDTSVGLKTLSPTKMVGVAGFTMLEVAPFTTTSEAEGASDNVVPDTVIAGPPGASV
jgi:hypothetical protein